MGQITITLSDRTFRLRCRDGEEKRLLEFSDYLSAHVDRLEDRVGQVGNDRLLLMAALTIAGELFDVREKLDRLEAEAANASHGAQQTPIKTDSELEPYSEGADPPQRRESI